MKSPFLFPIIMLLFLLFAMSSCLKDDCDREVTYINYTPIYKTFTEIRNGKVTNEQPRELCEPGKIYFYDNYIFINEGRDGVHIIDNTNPENPANIGFIGIPGNQDISIKNNYMYANSDIDLLTIDITDVQNAALISRTENVFPPIWENQQNGEVLLYYEQEEVTEVLDCDTYGALNKGSNGGWWGCANCNVFAFDDMSILESSVGASGGGQPTGVGGSMARFSIIGNYLYVVDESQMHLFNLSAPAHPAPGNSITVGWGIETIFPYQDKLFIGSNSGMYIYDNSTPEQPIFVSEFQHARACDPVFVKDNLAYVTLRDGTFCEGFANQLDLIDITDIYNPFLVESFPMDNPHGLSIKDNNLFICEGSHGLKVFDITEPTELANHKLDQRKDGHAYDAIVVPNQSNTLLVIGEDGFNQYDFTNPRDLALISSINSSCN